MNQVVVVPYPGRGHINPLISLCHFLSSKLNQQNITTIYTIVVTEEWLGFIKPNPDDDCIRFVTIPNVIPSELNRGLDLIAFIAAVNTKMEHPFEEVLDRMKISVDLIIADATMVWPFDVANRRNIPVAAYWPMSASMFSIIHHIDLLESHNHLYIDVSEKGMEVIDYIPGLSSLKVADLPASFHGKSQRTSEGLVPNLVSGSLPNLDDSIKKANYVLLSTIYELESSTIDALKAGLQIPIYTCGPNIPYSQIKLDTSSHEVPIYIDWLASKQPGTVLYVSLGSFLSISRVELDELAAGLRQSGVNFLWVVRGENSHLKEFCGEQGMVVEWCDQLRVLSHSSIGGFLTHCGWNSVKEGLFSGVPMLTYPLWFDQQLNRLAIIKDWRNGSNMRKESGVVIKRDEIAEVVRRFMDQKSDERIEMMERAKGLKEVCQESVVEGGSANQDIDAFIRDNVLDQKK